MSMDMGMVIDAARGHSWLRRRGKQARALRSHEAHRGLHADITFETRVRFAWGRLFARPDLG